VNKKFLLTWLAIFIVWMVGSFIVHGAPLESDYLKVPQLFRTAEESKPYFPLMLLAHILLSGAFVWIYARGIAPRPCLGQGIRFGFAVALLTTAPTYLIYFVVQAMPAMLVAKQIVFDGLLLLVLGAVTAFVYRGQALAQ